MQCDVTNVMSPETRARDRCHETVFLTAAADTVRHQEAVEGGAGRLS